MVELITGSLLAFSCFATSLSWRRSDRIFASVLFCLRSSSCLILYSEYTLATLCAPALSSSSIIMSWISSTPTALPSASHLATTLARTIPTSIVLSNPSPPVSLAAPSALKSADSIFFLSNSTSVPFLFITFKCCLLFYFRPCFLQKFYAAFSKMLPALLIKSFVQIALLIKV